MKNFGRTICCLLAAATFSLSTILAAEYTQYADTLNQLDLFQGTDQGYELDSPLTREQAAAMIVRLMGDEETALAAQYTPVFSDVEACRWSFPYVMYCYENSVTKGTSESTFTPETPISAQEFTTFILRLLGHTDSTPESAYEDAVSCGLYGTEFVRDLEGSDTFLRDDMVYISYRALKTKTTDDNILAEELADRGVITAQQAEEFDAYSADDFGEMLDELLE